MRSRFICKEHVKLGQGQPKPSRGKLVENLITDPEKFEDIDKQLRGYDSCHACWGNINGNEPKIKWLTRWHDELQVQPESESANDSESDEIFRSSADGDFVSELTRSSKNWRV